MSTGTTVTALAYAGVGAGVGTIGASIISSRSGKGESRAHAAEMISAAAGGLTDRMGRLNDKLDTDNRDLRLAVRSLTDVIDLLLPYLTTAPPAVLAKAKKINDRAKQVI